MRVAHREIQMSVAIEIGAHEMSRAFSCTDRLRRSEAAIPRACEHRYRGGNEVTDGNVHDSVLIEIAGNDGHRAGSGLELTRGDEFPRPISQKQRGGNTTGIRSQWAASAGDGRLHLHFRLLLPAVAAQAGHGPVQNSADDAGDRGRADDESD